jgi:hypothetical protein
LLYPNASEWLTIAPGSARSEWKRRMIIAKLFVIRTHRNCSRAQRGVSFRIQLDGTHHGD